ncbi:MAG: metal ABC transporter ATP-binding protein [Bacteroidales bacterium]
MENKQIEISNLSAGYDGKIILNDVNLTINKCDFLGIIGPNGGGKTTLLKNILGLNQPISGNIQYYRDGKKVEDINIGYLPQTNTIDKHFPITVSDVVLSGLKPINSLRASYNNEQRERVNHTLNKIGMYEKRNNPIGELSGGQLQRALLGRAIISNPELLILDEPNSYLDREFETRLYQILQEVNLESTIIMVSHNITTVCSVARSLACVNHKVHYHPSAQISHECIYETLR